MVYCIYYVNGIMSRWGYCISRNKNTIFSPFKKTAKKRGAVVVAVDKKFLGECQLWYFFGGGGFPIMTVVVAPKELRIYVFVLNFILHISHSLRYGLIWLHYPNASCLSICCNMMTNIHKELL